MVAKYLVSNASGNPINISIHVCPDKEVAEMVASDLEESYGKTQTLEFETDSEEILNLSLDMGGNLIGAIEPFEFIWEPDAVSHKIRFIMHLQHFWEVLTEFRSAVRTEKAFVRLHGANDILCLRKEDAAKILASMEARFENLKARAEHALSSFRQAVESTNHPALPKPKAIEPGPSDN